MTTLWGPSNRNVPRGMRFVMWSTFFRHCKFIFRHDTCRHTRRHYSKRTIGPERVIQNTSEVRKKSLPTWRQASNEAKENYIIDIASYDTRYGTIFPLQKYLLWVSIFYPFFDNQVTGTSHTFVCTDHTRRQGISRRPYGGCDRIRSARGPSRTCYPVSFSLACSSGTWEASRSLSATSFWRQSFLILVWKSLQCRPRFWLASRIFGWVVLAFAAKKVYNI